MTVRALFLCGAIVCPPTLAAPLPVNPTVNPAYRPGTVDVEVRLRQDRCYLWGTPAVSSTGTAYSITQTVTARPTCADPGADVVRVNLGQLPVGTYSLRYSATPEGTLSPHVLDFSVRPLSPRFLSVFPAQPVALEPVHVSLSIIDTCEFVTGVVPTAGGFDVLVRQEFANPASCDSLIEAEVTLGSLAPGHYRLRAVPAADPSQAPLSTLEFDVSPQPPTALLRDYVPDYSGIWNSPDQEPYTAIDFINSFDQTGPTTARSGLSGLWYTYDATGRPIWYFIEANNQGAGFGRLFVGGVFEYRPADPSLPAFARTIAGTRVGDIQIRFGYLDTPAQVTATINGVPREFRLQRFRWLRWAWPPRPGTT